MIEGLLIELAKQGVVGLVAAIFIFFYRKERKKVDELTSSFNAQVADLNEKRAEEIRIMAEALTSTSDANHDVARSLERLRDFVIEERLRESSNEDG